MDSKEIRNFLWEHLRVHKKWLLMSFFFAALLAAAKVWLVKIVQPLIDQGLTGKNFNETVRVAILLVILVFGDGLFSYLHRLTLRTGVERTILDIKNRLFQKILIFSQKQMARLDSGKAVTLLFNDTSVMTQGLHIASDLIRQPLTIVALIGYLFYLNWKLCLVCMIALPIVGWVTKKLGESSRRNQKRIQIALDKASQHSLESIQGLRTAHAFGRIAFLKKEFEEKTYLSYKPTIKQASVQEIIAPISKLLFGGTGALLVMVCGYLTARGQMTTGEVISFISAAGLLQDPIRQLNHVHVRMQEVYASTERILNTMNSQADAVSLAQASLLINDTAHRASQSTPHTLELKNVSFSYRESSNTDEAKAVNTVSFTLNPGKKIALVGPSGSGKSTISLLTMRYLDPENGQVLLDGRSATEWPVESYRANFSYVSQDVFLFSKTLRENLLFANPEATEEQIWDALDKSQLKTFVESLPEKLDTIIQERALNLSGGEKQRIAIARAILRNAPIVILDEATSQLDIENELLIHQAMNFLVKGKSVIIIAHRLSTVREVDEVIVMNHGKVIERGSPQDLVEQTDSWFSRMWGTQGIT